MSVSGATLIPSDGKIAVRSGMKVRRGYRSGGGRMDLSVPYDLESWVYSQVRVTRGTQLTGAGHNQTIFRPDFEADRYTRVRGGNGIYDHGPYQGRR